MNGSLYTWASINPYFASYLYYNGNPDVKPEDTAFLMPCIFLIQYCFMTIGVKLGDCVGPRFATLIAICFMYVSYAIMLLFKNYYLILAAMGIFGLGDGLGNLSVIKNAWKYFPEHTALVNGIIIGGLGISSAVLTPIADYIIINPENIDTDDNGYYPKNVADNLVKFLYFLSILFLILGVIAFSLTFKYENEPSSTDDIFGKAAEMESEERPSLSTERRSSMKVLCEGFWSWKNFILFCFCFCGPCKLNIFLYIIFLFL